MVAHYDVSSADASWYRARKDVIALSRRAAEHLLSMFNGVG